MKNKYSLRYSLKRILKEELGMDDNESLALEAMF